MAFNTALTWFSLHEKDFTSLPTPAVTDTSIYRSVVSVTVCLRVCVHALKEKRLELSTLDVVDIQCVAVAVH